MGGRESRTYLGESNVQQRKVNVTSVVAATFWVVAVGFTLAGTIVAIAMRRDLGVALALMAHGIVCSAAAATATVRGYIDGQLQLLTDVFELGRDSGNDIRPMRNRG